MRWLVLWVLVLVSSSPLSASAQEASTLQLELDAAGVDVVASPARTVDGYTLKQMEKRVQRARKGLGVSVVPFVAGTLFIMAGTVGYDCFLNSDRSEKCGRLLYTGVGLATVGTGGIIASAIMLRRRKGKLRTLREAAYYERRRRAEWDVERSRLVF